LDSDARCAALRFAARSLATSCLTWCCSRAPPTTARPTRRVAGWRRVAPQPFRRECASLTRHAPRSCACATCSRARRASSSPCPAHSRPAAARRVAPRRPRSQLPRLTFASRRTCRRTSRTLRC
jgi:hypothetical protein